LQRGTLQHLISSLHEIDAKRQHSVGCCKNATSIEVRKITRYIGQVKTKRWFGLEKPSKKISQTERSAQSSLFKIWLKPKFSNTTVHEELCMTDQQPIFVIRG